MDDIDIDTPQSLWDWLDANHARPKGVRIVTYKAHVPDKYVSRDDILDAVMAYGWVDGRRFTVDADRTAQLIAPRQQQAWSQSYKDRVERLQADGRMRPAGEAAVAAGRAPGLWDHYADVDALIVPDDLAADLDRSTWDAIAPSYRRNVLRWIHDAKTAPTRAKRIAAAQDATARGIKLPQM
ncbi:YdeI family protein [Pseudooctadecabacter sp.]|uniref:YdeI/OmpD-associated family protein n=1 Tax=Pseudooctadecabacter sp. TaxID=1966338 RepID=UPI0035C7BFE9